MVPHAGNPFIRTRYFALSHLNPSQFYEWVFQWSVRDLLPALPCILVILMLLHAPQPDSRLFRHAAQCCRVA